MFDESLKPYIERAEKGLLRMVSSPCGELVLFNYSDQCTFERAWDEYTLAARGIIFEKATGKIVARPFGKFFNYEEHAQDGMRPLSEMLDQPHYIQEKMDGSLGIIYWWNDRWNVATRGSLTSEQSIRGAEILKKYNVDGLHPAWTSLVEIIYPENKIIVPYGDEEKLVLLASRRTGDGRYADQLKLQQQAAYIGMPLVKSIPMTIADALEKKKSIPFTEEGWVVVFDDGSRLKIKGDDYMRIAKFKANLSPIAVWEALMEDKMDEMIKGCPDEIMQELLDIKDRLVIDAGHLFLEMRSASADIDWLADRKTVALEIQKRPKWMHAALFCYLTHHGSPHMILLKKLRPTGNQFVDIDSITGEQ